MKQQDFERMLETVAKKEGISNEQVRREMQEAMDEAMNNPDPMVQMRWKFIPCKGAQPTLEEFVEYLLRFV
jgi:hypothetical protein